MNDEEYNKLRTASNLIMEGLYHLITDRRDDDKFLYELKQYIDSIRRNGYEWDLEKVQVILSVLQSKNPSEIQEIISYMDRTNYGWQGDTYKFYNRCSDCCRRESYIESTPEATEWIFSDMDKIFLHKEYGAITTYLFGYCLASLFSRRLKERHQSIPYFLQIACKRNSNVYRLVHEIVHICDVNTGLFENCNRYRFGECDHDHLTIYPSETGDELLETLLYYRDIPIIVDGYENEKLYEILIREVANIPRKTKRLDIRAKFNILPVFIAPAIRSQFQNVFCIDLTELNIVDEYIDTIRENKQYLGSWAFGLVAQAEQYFGVWNSTSYSQRAAIAKLLEKRNPDEKKPMFYDLVEYIGRVRTKHNRCTKLTSKDINNIGYLSYFFSYYMKKAFRNSIRINEGTAFTYRGIYDKHRPAELIDQIVEQATDSLVRLHSVCSPAMPEILNIDIGSADEKKAKKIKEKADAYAKGIVNYYRSYKVNLRISNVKYKDERYVFSVKLLPGTDAKLLSRYAEEVRRLLEIEVFILDISSAEIKLVASEKPLYENSLIKILESDRFKESKMEIPYAVGYDILGEIVIADIAKFPHLIVGGTSNSGKSSALHSLLMSIVYRQPASKVKLLLIDFGSSDLKIFDKVPHMLKPTINVGGIEEARRCLLGLQSEMEKRLKRKDVLDKKKFDVEFKKWPSIICVIDEFPAFVRQLTEGKQNRKAYTIVEDILSRARKVKIHLVLTAQNASKGNIDIGNTNLGAGIAFRCMNQYDSRAIIGHPDATNLFGEGTMYFRCGQFEGIKRIKGAFMDPDEIINRLDTMNFIIDDKGKAYDEVKLQFNSLQKFENLETDYESSSIEDEKLFMEIVMWIQDKEDISNNQLKHKFEMGYERANRFLMRLEDAGLISAQKRGSKLARMVNQEEVRRFLNSHRDIDENVLDQAIDIAELQEDKEFAREQNIEQIVDNLDVPELEDSFVDTSPKRQKKKIIIRPDAKGSLKGSHKAKRRPAH